MAGLKAREGKVFAGLGARAETPCKRGGKRVNCRRARTFVANSAPMVALNSSWNSFMVKRDSRLDLPTPLLPIRTTCGEAGKKGARVVIVHGQRKAVHRIARSQPSARHFAGGGRREERGGRYRTFTRQSY